MHCVAVPLAGGAPPGGQNAKRRRQPLRTAKQQRRPQHKPQPRLSSKRAGGLIPVICHLLYLLYLPACCTVSQHLLLCKHREAMPVAAMLQFVAALQAVNKGGDQPVEVGEGRS